jgi:hypothetical protein
MWLMTTEELWYRHTPNACDGACQKIPSYPPIVALLRADARRIPLLDVMVAASALAEQIPVAAQQPGS